MDLLLQKLLSVSWNNSAVCISLAQEGLWGRIWWSTDLRMQDIRAVFLSKTPAYIVCVQWPFTTAGTGNHRGKFSIVYIKLTESLLCFCTGELPVHFFLHRLPVLFVCSRVQPDIKNNIITKEFILLFVIENKPINTSGWFILENVHHEIASDITM